MTTASRRDQEPALTGGDEWRVLRSQVWDVERRASLGSGPGEATAQIALLAGAVARLIGAEVGRSRRAQRANAEAEALDEIARALSGTQWDADTACTVAEIVRRTGRTISDTEAAQ
jgi:hypothetical protein